MLVDHLNTCAARFCVIPARKRIPCPVDGIQRHSFPIGDIVGVDLPALISPFILVADQILSCRIHRIERLIALRARKGLIIFAAAVRTVVPAEKVMPQKAAIGQVDPFIESDRQRLLRPAARNKRSVARVQMQLKFKRHKARIQGRNRKNVACIDDRDRIAALFRIVPADKFVPVERDGQKGHALAKLDHVRICGIALVIAFKDIADNIGFGFKDRIQIQRFVYVVKAGNIFAAAVRTVVPAEKVMPQKAAIGQVDPFIESDRQRLLRPAARNKRSVARVQMQLKFKRHKARIQGRNRKNVACIDDRDRIAALFRIVPADKFVPVERDGQKGHALAKLDHVRICGIALVIAFKDIADNIGFGFKDRIQIQRFVYVVKAGNIFAAAVFLRIPPEEGISRLACRQQLVHFADPDGDRIFPRCLPAHIVIQDGKERVALLPERIQRYVGSIVAADAVIFCSALRPVVPTEEQAPLPHGLMQQTFRFRRNTRGIAFIEDAASQFIPNGIDRIAPLGIERKICPGAGDPFDGFPGIIWGQIPPLKGIARLFGDGKFHAAALECDRGGDAPAEKSAVQPIIDRIFMRRKDRFHRHVLRDRTGKRHHFSRRVPPADKIVSLPQRRFRHIPGSLGNGNLLPVHRHHVNLRLRGSLPARQ